jgi:hypothetical protein
MNAGANVITVLRAYSSLLMVFPLGQDDIAPFRVIYFMESIAI